MTQSGPKTRGLRKVRNRRLFAGLWLLASVLLPGCGPNSSPHAGPRDEKPTDAKATADDTTAQPSTKLTLALNWFPESEHGGYYAAQVRGYYRAAGFDVAIQSGGPNARMLEQVATGRSDFGVANADNILFGRAQGLPVVAVMAPLQNSPRCLIAHKASGIEDFDQLRDVTLAMTPGAAFADFLRWKLPLPGVRIVPYSGTVQAFLLDPRYVQQAYTFSEPFLARQQGADPIVLLVSELGFNPYTSLLFTTENMLANRPEDVRHMVAATVRGWQDYLADPEPTNELIHERNTRIDLEALAFGAKEIAPLMITDAVSREELGAMTLERWQALERQLVESGQLKAGTVDPRQAFTTEFLPTGARAKDPAP